MLDVNGKRKRCAIDWKLDHVGVSTPFAVGTSRLDAIPNQFANHTKDQKEALEWRRENTKRKAE